jgi:DNA-binding CsgD family transcriptional regulator
MIRTGVIVHRAFELTEREQEVCRLLAEGLAPQEIANRLAIKPGSVYRHLVTIREKMECDHLVALVAKVCQGAPASVAWPVRRRREAARDGGQIALFLDL